MAKFSGADEAFQRGYVSRVLDSKEECLAEAYKIANLIAQKSPVAINITKKSLIYSRDHTV